MEKTLLDPSSREIYLDHLRPPTGYRLDGAVATTFSLDLMSLLMAPVAMALEDKRIRGQTISDPVVVVEAIQHCVDRFAVFCHKGRIAVPRHETLLYGYLEKSVIEVQSPDPEGVFHPKTWLLRYVEENGAPVRYRFLCLSRNLTLDNSWDTVLSLEGTVSKSRSKGYGLNRPLGDFHLALPGLTNGTVSAETGYLVKSMGEEVKRVQFEPPDGFERIEQFIPIGLQGHKRFPKVTEHKRALVLSPFLSPNGLKRIARDRSSHIVISRLDALDGLSDSLFNKLSANTDFYFLDEGAERPEEIEQEEGNSVDQTSSKDDFTGLHAKLIIAENGAKARLYTGSANATGAAFTGRNVEFVVALSGYRRKVGIEPFLGDENAKFAFRNMLRPYTRPEEKIKPTQREKLEEALEQGRKALIAGDLRIRINQDDQSSYLLSLSSKSHHLKLPGSVRGTCFPIALPEDHARDLTPLTRKSRLDFENLTREALTTFMGFRLEAKRGGEIARIAFVLNLPVVGMPDGRDSGILRRILSDRESFIRYLLLILGGEADFIKPSFLKKKDGFFESHLRDVIPLFEEMVRAYSREPDKIRRIDRLIADLREAGGLDEILPPGFEEVWAAFSNAAIRGKRA